MGAMGFTHEHVLHHYTRRLWVWRRDFRQRDLLGREDRQAYRKAGPEALWGRAQRQQIRGVERLPHRPIFQYLADLERQRVERERLRRHFHSRDEERGMAGGVLGVARDEQNFSGPDGGCRAISASWRPFNPGKPTSVISRSSGVLDVSMGSAPWPSLASMQA